MENRFGAPASGTPEERSARREFELLLLLSGSRKGAVQLWKWERRQRIYANAQQAAGRPATEAKGPRGAAERQAGGCLLYTSPSPRDGLLSRMPSSA